MPDCIFCKIIAGEIPAEKIFENGKVMVFLDNNPLNRGHALAVPKTHSKNLTEADDDALCETILAIKKLVPKILKVVGAESYNLIVNSGSIAGQIVFHTHFHIVPRFSDDGHKHFERSKMKEKPYKDGGMAQTAGKIRKEIV